MSRRRRAQQVVGQQAGGHQVCTSGSVSALPSDSRRCGAGGSPPSPPARAASACRQRTPPAWSVRWLAFSVSTKSGRGARALPSSCRAPTAHALHQHRQADDGRTGRSCAPARARAPASAWRRASACARCADCSKPASCALLTGNRVAGQEGARQRRAGLQVGVVHRTASGDHRRRAGVERAVGVTDQSVAAIATSALTMRATSLRSGSASAIACYAAASAAPGRAALRICVSGPLRRFAASISRSMSAAVAGQRRWLASVRRRPRDLVSSAAPARTWRIRRNVVVHRIEAGGQRPRACWPPGASRRRGAALLGRSP